MGALIVASLVILATLGWCFVLAFANGMSAAPSQDGQPIMPWLVGGFTLAALIAATHWLPHIGW